MVFFNESFSQKAAEKIIKTYESDYICGNITEELFLNKYQEMHKDEVLSKDWYTVDWWCFAKHEGGTADQYKEIIFVILKNKLNKLDREIITDLYDKDKKIYCKQLVFENGKLKIRNWKKLKTHLSSRVEKEILIDATIIKHWLMNKNSFKCKKRKLEDDIIELIYKAQKTGIENSLVEKIKEKLINIGCLRRLEEGYKKSDKETAKCIKWLKRHDKLEEKARNILKIYYCFEYFSLFYPDYYRSGIRPNLDLIIADDTGTPVYYEIKFLYPKELYYNFRNEYHEEFVVEILDDTLEDDDKPVPENFYWMEEIQFRLSKIFIEKNKMRSIHAVLDNSAMTRIHICDYLKIKKEKKEQLCWKCMEISKQTKAKEIKIPKRKIGFLTNKYKSCY